MGVQQCPLLCCITPAQEGGSQQSSPHMATSLSGLWRGGCQDSQDGGMGWARGLLPVPPSPNCRRGGDVGSCSTKPCSFSPLKPDYLAVPVCVRAREGGGGGISQQQVFAATLGPAAPESPQGQQHSIRSRKALAVTAEPMALLEQPGMCAGHAGAWQEVSTGPWRWMLWLPVGLKVGTAARDEAWKWMLQLPVWFGDGHCSPWWVRLGGGYHGCPWDLEVDVAALTGVWRQTLWLPMGFGSGCWKWLRIGCCSSLWDLG